MQTLVRYNNFVISQLTLDASGPLLSETTFVVLDCETTGLSPSSNAITELAAIKVCGGETVGTFHTLINPQQRMSARIVAMTGITNEELQQCPTIDEILPTFLEFLSDDIIVGHNIGFDISFLNAALIDNDFPTLSNSYFDTLSLAKKIIPREVPNFKLSTLAQHAHSKVIPTHRAFDDVQATIEVFHYLIERSSFLGVTGVMDLRTIPSVNKRKRFSKRELAHDAPRTSGIYMFVSNTDEVLYIGMSRNIKQRFSAYFTSDNRKKIDDMLARSHHIEYMTTPTAFEASIAELRLLTKMKPQYNIVDTLASNNYVVAADRFEAAPTFRVLRDTYTSDHIAFGPFTSRNVATNFCDALNTSLELRTCTAVCTPGTKHGSSPCMNSFRGLHECFCVDNWNSSKEYVAQFHESISVLVSHPEQVTARVLQEMRTLSDSLQFEKAKIKHDHVTCIQKWMNRFMLIHDAHIISTDENSDMPKFTYGRPTVRFSTRGSGNALEHAASLLHESNHALSQSSDEPIHNYNNLYICHVSEFRERYYTALFLARNNLFTTDVTTDNDNTVAIDHNATSATTIL